ARRSARRLLDRARALAAARSAQSVDRGSHGLEPVVRRELDAHPSLHRVLVHRGRHRRAALYARFAQLARVRRDSPVGALARGAIVSFRASREGGLTLAAPCRSRQGLGMSSTSRILFCSLLIGCGAAPAPEPMPPPPALPAPSAAPAALEP